jgi:hypothetical protein
MVRILQLSPTATRWEQRTAYGGAVNIAVYAASASAVPIFKSWLIIPLALGSGFGLLVTYSMSRYVAFRPTNT